MSSRRDRLLVSRRRGGARGVADVAGEPASDPPTRRRAVRTRRPLTTCRRLGQPALPPHATLGSFLLVGRILPTQWVNTTH
jgi:hypothetical protein